MTPERVAEIAWDIYDESCTPLNRIERAITQAVNEAINEAANKCIYAAARLPTSDEGACEICERDIRALKLPEEP